MTKKTVRPEDIEIETETEEAKAALAKQLSKLLSGKEKKAQLPPKQKVIRDSFTLPESDYTLIKTLQDRGFDLRMHITKSELLRAGLHALEKMSEAELLEILQTVEKLKPGRRRDS
ncbi:MAG: hypothetical protein GY862_23445 [Gammaproteobacteria bacterium]|nr:hypothetical protein [Gammaproteobacteria bacterium]